MKESIINFVKNNRLLGWIYVHIMLLVFHICDVFINPKDKRVLFTSYSGRQYSDSPKVIYKAMVEDKNFSEYEMIWAFRDVKDFPEIPKEKKIKINSFKYIVELFKAKYWISNSSIERLIPINSKKHIYINTWHGVPMKHLGQDEKNLKYAVKNWYKKVEFDILFCSGMYDQKLFRKIFPKAKNIQNVGLPRNKELLKIKKNEKEVREEVINKLNLNKRKKILLYAPTFREYDLDIVNMENKFFEEKNLLKLSEKYNILVRGHYFTKDNNLNTNVIDVSNYDNLNNLMVSSDILVSDYSSIVFDYLLLEKPIILYMYDLKKYKNHRGLYLNPFDFFDATTEISKVIEKVILGEFRDTSRINKIFNSMENPVETIKNDILKNNF